MRKFALWIASLAVVACPMMAANAATVDFDWSFTGAGGGSGQLTASLVGGDEYLVNSITGTVDGSSIGMIEPVNTYALNTNQILYPPPSGPIQLGDGLEFTCPSCGGVDMFFAFEGTDYLETGLAGFSQNDTPIQFTGSQVSATPLPATLPMFGAALLFLGIFARRRLQSV